MPAGKLQSSRGKERTRGASKHSTGSKSMGTLPVRTFRSEAYPIPPGGYREKFLDIISAYCIVAIHPEDQLLLGVKWQWEVYIDARHARL